MTSLVKVEFRALAKYAADLEIEIRNLILFKFFEKSEGAG